MMKLFCGMKANFLKLNNFVVLHVYLDGRSTISSPDPIGDTSVHAFVLCVGGD